MRIFGLIFGLILLAAVPQQANAGHSGQPQEAEFGQIMIMGSDGWAKLDSMTGSAVIPTEKELDDKLLEIGPRRPRPGPLRSIGHDPAQRPDKNNEGRKR